MANPPDDPKIPTLTRVLRRARSAQDDSRETSSSGSTGSHPMPRDLDIDLQLGELDRLADESRVPAAPPVAADALATSREAQAALASRVETLVDEAIAAYMGPLRERLITDLMRLLSEDSEASVRDPPGD